MRRWLLTILFVVLLGIPVFGWVQYRQAQNLDRLTDQSFSNFEWDAFKLELRVIYLRKALHEVLMHPRSPQQLAQASKEYNLLAGQVLLIDKGRSRESMEDHPDFKSVMAQSLAFLKLAEPLLEDAHLDPDDQAMQVLIDHADNLQGNVHRLVITAHDMRALRSVQMIKEVQSINYSFAVLSAVLVMLGAVWGVSAMRNLKLSSQRQQELNALYLKSSFSASHDFLTGLANRRQLYDQLRHAIASSRRTGVCTVPSFCSISTISSLSTTPMGTMGGIWCWSRRQVG